MNKRSILALLLAFMLVFSSFAAYAQEDNGEEVEVEVEVTVEETEEAEENGEATDEENGEATDEDEEADAEAVEAEETEVDEEAVEEEEEAAFAPVLPQINLLMNLGQNTAYVNGEAVELDVAPYVVEGRTMVPARFVSESLGFEVDWDEEAKAVMVLYGDVVAISMTIGEETATVWGEEVELEVAPYIAEDGDRTMVPLRFVSESLGFEVDWDEETKGITIDTPEVVVEEDVEADLEVEVDVDEEVEVEVEVDTEEETDTEEVADEAVETFTVTMSAEDGHIYGEGSDPSVAELSETHFEFFDTTEIEAGMSLTFIAAGDTHHYVEWVVNGEIDEEHSGFYGSQTVLRIPSLEEDLDVVARFIEYVE